MSSSTDSTETLRQARGKMYAELFTKSSADQIFGFQNSEVLRGAEALKKAIELKKSSNKKDHKIILAYTSNIISSGLRECIASLIADGAVDAIVTTAGGIEEDLIKCLGPTLVGDFTLEGSSLRDKGLNRIGNLLVPNNNYVLFESFFRTVLHQHLDAQKNSRCAVEHCAPSDILKSSGEYLTKIEQLVEQQQQLLQMKKEGSGNSRSSSIATTSTNETTISSSGIENDDGFSEHLSDIDLAVLKQQLRYSVAYQGWKHNVPILCPAFTDGSMGDMTFFFNVSYPGLIVDPLLDAVKLEKLLLPAIENESSSVSVFSVGGGLPKHFAMRAAADSNRRFTSAVLITTTGPQVDGSVSAGSEIDDNTQFGRNNNSCCDELIHVRVEATLCFPFMCALAMF